MLDELSNMTFVNEAEEAAWWESNEDALSDEFDKATAEGRVGCGTLVIRDATSVAHICLDSDDIDRARIQAADRGLRYQTYLKMIIHEALRNAESASRSANS